MSSEFSPINRQQRSLTALQVAQAAQGVAEAAAMEGGEVELREYFRVVFKYRKLIGAVVVLSGLLSLIYAFTATPQYTAESKIRISSYEPVLIGADIESVLEQKSKEGTFLETQIEEIKSFSIADKVLANEQVNTALSARGKAGFFTRLFTGEKKESREEMDEVDRAAGYEHPIRMIRSYLDMITIKPIRRTSLVTIGATSETAKLAALVANKHAEAYIEWVRENRIEQQARGLEFLRAQADELREKVADLERELADYAEANSIVAVNKDENITAQKMSQLNQLLTSAIAKRIQFEHEYLEALKAVNSSGNDDSSTQQMRSDLAKLESEYSLLSEKFTPQYPKMKQLASQIEQLKQSITGQRGQTIEGMKARAEAAKKEEENLKEELEQQKSLAFELSKKQVQYNILNRELTSSRELLQNILKQSKETSIAVESNASNISIIDYAVVPKDPSFPKKKLIALLGLLLGLGAGLGLSFLLHYLDNTVKTPEDVQRELRLPSLGVVPSFELDWKGPMPGVSGPTASAPQGPTGSALPTTAVDLGLGLPIMFISSPQSLAAEAYRAIRTGILLSQAGEPPKTILVTSSQSSEGKTTSSVNLAASLASAGAKVALVDADLRRPTVLKHFNLDSSGPGLVEIITGQRTIEEVSIRDKVKRITVIPSGSIPPNPAELLGSLEMASIIDKLSIDYDYVIIDCPPVLPVTDAVILSRYVDGVVLVCRGATTPRRVIQDAKDRLLRVGARVLGVVLNDVDVRGGDYYYYNRYYHSYYSKNTDGSDPVRKAG